MAKESDDCGLTKNCKLTKHNTLLGAFHDFGRGAYLGHMTLKHELFRSLCHDVKILDPLSVFLKKKTVNVKTGNKICT